jgi:Fur family ferric uptake transcriptional regulator
MTHDLLDYPRKMRRSGYRVTPQRKAILDAICEAGRRISVEEIITRLHKKSPTLNRATVYRNLFFLQKMHLVNAAGSGKARKFEIASLEPDHHLVCRMCGREEELNPKYIDRLRAMIRKEHLFIIDNDHLSFQGLCPQCSSGRTRKIKGAKDFSK